MRRFLISFASLLVFAALAVGLWEVFRSSGKEADTNSPKPMPLPEPVTYETKPQVGYLAPNFSLKTAEGQEVRLADYLGKVVILDWWATWCPLCKTQYDTMILCSATDS
jgi:thiol-disulfide isomerase/thioredoxin